MLGCVEIIEITEGEWTEIEGLSSKGKRVKAWYQRVSDEKKFLYKLPKVFESQGYITSEIWTEIIAYHLGKALGLTIPEAQIARTDCDYGVLVENFLQTDEILIEAKDFLKFRSKKYSHNVCSIKEFFDSDPAWESYKTMLVFDCLIGNNDRHDENWGICYLFNNSESNVQHRFSPFYDNASCLIRELSDQEIESKWNTDEKILKYVENGKPPNLYWNNEDKTRYNHFELLEKLIQDEATTTEIIEDFLKIDYIDAVNEIMKEIRQLEVPQAYIFSEHRSQIILKILELRKQRMKQLLTL
jgi:hypothetical protein